MKDTYNDGKIEFNLLIHDSENLIKKFPFEDLYGMGCENVLKMVSNGRSFAAFYLEGIREFRDPGDNTESGKYAQISQFRIDSDVETFEDVISNFFQKEMPVLMGVEKIHALCFLERYCMEYEEVKKMIKKKV